VSALLLSHFDSTLPTMLETDISDRVIAGVLFQKQSDREWHLVVYYSKTMIEAELNYPIHNKEILAIISGFKHWCIHLEGIPETVQVVSNHRALEYFITTKALTAQQACWTETLSQFNFQIMYKPGKTNQADALTRQEQNLEDQAALKIALQVQTLLPTRNLDP
jgi:hypothetical protein